jgi:serine/threonine protein kinase
MSSQRNSVCRQSQHRSQDRGSAKGTKGKPKPRSRYLWRQGEVLQGRYLLLEEVGRGSFGQVLRAYDRQQQAYLALKVVKKDQKVLAQARKEERILRVLNSMACEWVVQLKDAFLHKGHMVPPSPVPRPGTPGHQPPRGTSRRALSPARPQTRGP